MDRLSRLDSESEKFKFGLIIFNLVFLLERRTTLVLLARSSVIHGYSQSSPKEKHWCCRHRRLVYLYH